MARSLEQLRRDAKRCQDCPLWANATQTVFGAGDPHARVMLVGEQPGFKVSTMRVRFVESALAPHVFATFHPSAFKRLVKDLGLINKALS